jgi:hypothetical protein
MVSATEIGRCTNVLSFGGHWMLGSKSWESSAEATRRFKYLLGRTPSHLTFLARHISQATSILCRFGRGSGTRDTAGWSAIVDVPQWVEPR